VEPRVSRGEDHDDAEGRYDDDRYDDRYEVVASDWPFPDPSEPAPTGLLPSTAGARRRARVADGD
jgi:hypothetical protein